MISLKKWEKKDPIKLFENKILKEKIFSKKEIEKIQIKINDKINQSINNALDSNFPVSSELQELDDVYAKSSNFKIKPNKVMAYRNRGLAKEGIGDLKGACSDWREASRLGDEKPAKWVSNQCQ